MTPKLKISDLEEEELYNAGLDLKISGAVYPKVPTFP
jgi:hypothetical protein